MGSLLEGLENGAVKALSSDKAQALGPKWFDQAIGAGRAQVEQIPTSSLELRAVQATASMSLDKLVKHKDELVDLGYERTLAFLGHTAAGRPDQAVRILTAYGGGQGAWGAADQVISDAGDTTEQAARSQQKALAIVEDIGSTAAKAALPILLQIALTVL